MGFFGSLWQAAKETGEHAMKKADAAIDAARTSMEQTEAAHNQNVQAQINQMMAANPNLTEEQKAAMRRYAFKSGKLDNLDLPNKP